ncbi:hypothetical protein HY945_02355 [Candidatus Gottesmanbacteria bacterium]|nr:hypothetical protein [Candidatus Gottesmanbacteria bacterium]
MDEGIKPPESVVIKKIAKALSRDQKCFHLGPYRELGRDELTPQGEILFTANGTPLVPVRPQKKRE